MYDVYKKGLEEGRFSSMRDACKYISKHPAPCFYISAKWASEYIGRIERHQSLISLSTPMRRKILYLYRLYKEYLAEHPDNALPRQQIMEILVEKPAPEFYMKPDAVRIALRKVIWKVRRQMGWSQE